MITKAAKKPSPSGAVPGARKGPKTQQPILVPGTILQEETKLNTRQIDVG